MKTHVAAGHTSDVLNAVLEALDMIGPASAVKLKSASGKPLPEVRSALITLEHIGQVTADRGDDRITTWKLTTTKDKGHEQTLSVHRP